MGIQEPRIELKLSMGNLSEGKWSHLDRGGKGSERLNEKRFSGRLKGWSSDFFFFPARLAELYRTVTARGTSLVVFFFSLEWLKNFPLETIFR